MSTNIINVEMEGLDAKTKINKEEYVHEHPFNCI
jgi:hypothetical protein